MTKSVRCDKKYFIKMLNIQLSTLIKQDNLMSYL